MNCSHRCLPIVFLFPLLHLASPAAGIAPGEDPPDAWSCLEAVRERAFSETVEADFVQDFLPAGFSAGDRESGIMILGLPRCFRWDYRTPYKRSYLLCDDEVFTWNEGETTGRRLLLDVEAEPGLDLLRLEVGLLRQRFRIASPQPATEGWSMQLTPLEEGQITGAELFTDYHCSRLWGLRHRDAEGNETRFSFSGFRPPRRDNPFAPPSDLDWLED